MITLIHPSRSRIDRALRAHKHWVENSSGTIAIQHIISVDSDDPQLSEYMMKFTKSTLIIRENKNAVQAINNAAKYAIGEIIVVMSDDFECHPKWDINIANAFSLPDVNHFDLLLKTNDGIQSWIVTLPIMGIAFYERQGYIYNPEYHHMFCDTELTHRADLEKKLVFRPDLHFKHNHYTAGGIEPDQVTRKADSTWNQGMEVYLTNARNKFGLPPETDIYDIKVPEGRPHLSWLKKYIPLI